LLGAFAAAAAAAVFMVGCSDNGNPSAPLGNGYVFNQASVNYLTPQDNASYTQSFSWSRDLPVKALVSGKHELEKYYRACVSGWLGRDEADGVIYDDACKAVLDSYDNSYFGSKQLIALVLSASSGSNRYEVTNVEYQNRTFTVNVNQNVPFIGTADMKSWLILVELDAKYPFNTGIVVNVTDVSI